jgi:hypothetical protein
MCHHIAKPIAVVALEIRNAVPINLTHSQEDTKCTFQSAPCRAAILPEKFWSASEVGPGEERTGLFRLYGPQREKSRNAITSTGIVPAAATAKMKRISRTTCGTVHDVHFLRYAKFSRQPFSCTTLSYRVEPMAIREAIAFSRSLASPFQPQTLATASAPLAGPIGAISKRVWHCLLPVVQCALGWIADYGARAASPGRTQVGGDSSR